MASTAKMDSLLGELKRLVAASETGDLNITPDASDLSGVESEIVKLLGQILCNYRAATECTLMKYRLASHAQITLKNILNGMDALISVCRPDSGEILFLNDSIRKYFGIDGDGVGQTCYRLLQNREEPCEACPNSQLMKEPDKIIIWKQRDTVNGGILHKTARLIDWPGGGKAHLDYGIDITALIKAEESLERRDKMLDALNKAAIILISQTEETFDKTMSEGINLIADITGIERMSVSRNYEQPDGLYISQVYCWSKDNGSETDLVKTLSANSYAEHIPRWREVLSSGQIINGPARYMPEADTLRKFGCSTVLAIPVFIGCIFWGFVLFEELTTEREFSQDEVDVLRTASYMIAYAAIRNEEAKKFLREQRQMIGEIDRKTLLLQTVNNVSSIMIASTAETFDNDLPHSLETMAKAVKADRAYIWKNHMKDGMLFCSQLYEWAGDVEVQQGKAFAVETAYADSVPEWEEILSQGLCVNGIVSELSANEQAMLCPQNILSVVAVPIFLKGEFWGFIGFDDCHRERRFSKSEVAILRSASELVAEALVRHEMEESLRASSVELQRALTAAQTASVAKSDFLSSMSHEIRTPLNAVIGMTAIGRRSADAERKNYALDRIEEASTHLLGIINDILDMSKIEAGMLELSPVEFNFENMLSKVVTVIGHRVSEKQQQFSVTIDGNVPRFVIGDDQRLAQIIANLLSNAAKFTPEHGAIQLIVSQLGTVNGINEIQIEVADNGIGIPAEKQANLFKSFTQAESGISREFGGTGLGLSISKRLVEMMGGRIRVESSPGEGSRFIFTVKVPSGVKNVSSLLTPGVAWDTVRVLVVDGSLVTRQGFKDSFDRMGVQCVTAADGVDAHQIILKQGDFDVYFLEINTAVMGVGLMGYLKERGGHGAVILISSGEWEALQDKVLEVGAYKGLVKPILSSALVDCMNECLGNPHENHSNDNAGEFVGKFLLLAEDIEINREIVLSLLEDTGLSIECAENGMDVLSMVEENPGKYDLILMDMQMPIMDGLEATRQIRDLSSAWCKKIPIIAMTANVFKDDIKECLASGMNDHIGKPIDLDDMMGKLRRYLIGDEYSKHNLVVGGRSDLSHPKGNEDQTVKLTEGLKVSVDIRVFDEHGSRRVLSLPSYVEEISSDGYFLINTPICQGAYYPLPREEMLLIYFSAELPDNGATDMFVIPARFVERVVCEGIACDKLEPLGKAERSQRRACYRLPLSLSVSLRRTQSEEALPIDARMVNFSDGGMLIATDESLDQNERVTLDFSIGEPETVEGKVIRSETVPNGRHKYHVAIQFGNASDAQKERFYRFIMQKQLEKRRRQMVG